MKAALKTYFFDHLKYWNSHYNVRKMPWKGEKNPYHIWLSEIILQQTRVEQGLKYYYSFISAYPTIQALANAPDQEVFKLWEGLGYYSRCKNLLFTARYISNNLNGIFPTGYEEIISLKGIGTYTASAIASFAYNLPYAVVDGNVYRVLSRFFGIDEPIDSTSGKEFFKKLAYELLDKKAPGLYNQGIMDFGATICKPLPVCNDCPLNEKCKAFRNSTVPYLPVKTRKLVKKVRWFYYLVANHNNHLLIRKRTSKDIWQNLHEFVLIESDTALELEEITANKEFRNLTDDEKPFVDISPVFLQQLTHQTIKGQFIYIESNFKPELPLYEWMHLTAVSNIAFPKCITDYFQQSRLLL